VVYRGIVFATAILSLPSEDASPIVDLGRPGDGLAGGGWKSIGRGEARPSTV